MKLGWGFVGDRPFPRSETGFTGGGHEDVVADGAHWDDSPAPDLAQALAYFPGELHHPIHVPDLVVVPGEHLHARAVDDHG